MIVLFENVSLAEISYFVDLWNYFCFDICCPIVRCYHTISPSLDHLLVCNYVRDIRIAKGTSIVSKGLIRKIPCFYWTLKLSRTGSIPISCLQTCVNVWKSGHQIAVKIIEKLVNLNFCVNPYNFNLILVIIEIILAWPQASHW